MAQQQIGGAVAGKIGDAGHVRTGCKRLYVLHASDLVVGKVVDAQRAVVALPQQVVRVVAVEVAGTALPRAPSRDSPLRG